MKSVAETAVGEQRTVTLPDGSSVELNTASQVAIRYTARTRAVQLTRGEAHFTVASDRSRPFSVHAAGRVVTAVGTAFTVQLRRDAVEVTVAEGRVRLAESQAATSGIESIEPDIPLPALEAGQSASVACRFAAGCCTRPGGSGTQAGMAPGNVGLRG